MKRLYRKILRDTEIRSVFKSEIRGNRLGVYSTLTAAEMGFIFVLDTWWILIRNAFTVFLPRQYGCVVGLAFA
jgi:hypothetical protein